MTDSTPPIVVFSGPSLPPREARTIVPSATCHPPAAMGDVYHAARKHPRTIVLIDGVFEHQPAVWHREILWALHEGIRVYGASSMGALRAAELRQFGMQGVGSIFVDYAAGTLEDDDDVAVLHCPAELDFAPLTEAMVNMIATLKHAAERRVISSELQCRLQEIAKQQFYRERTWKTVLSAALHEVDSHQKAALQTFTSWLDLHAVNQKRLDAIEALEKAGTDDGHSCMDHNADQLGHSEHQFERNGYWQNFEPLSLDNLLDAGDRKILERITSADEGAQESIRARALMRGLALNLARRAGCPLDATRLLIQYERHRNRFDLHDDASLEQWLRSRGMTKAHLHRTIRENALVDQMCQKLAPDLPALLLDEAYLEG